MPSHHFFNLGLKHSPLLGNAPDLKHGRFYAYMRVEAACRCQYQVSGDRRIGKQSIRISDLLYPLLDRLKEMRIRGTKIASGRAARVISRLSAGRPTMKIFGAVELLPNEP